MSIPACVYITRSYVHRNDRYVRVAKLAGVDVNTWADMSRLYDKATHQHTLTSRELDEERTLLTDKNAEVRYRVLYGLAYCSDPAIRSGVIALAKVCLNDSAPPVRRRSIKNLKMLGDPELAMDVGKFVQDPAPEVRMAAQDALGGGLAGGKVP
jgi:HEAT repeat protein